MDVDPVIEAHFLGLVDVESCQALQHRLVYEISGQSDRRIVLLVCEHPAAITVGRLGSRAHIRISEQELGSRGLAVHWVNRGGGCVLHTTGQLAVYPIVPLEALGLTVGQYLERLQNAIYNTLAEFNLTMSRRPFAGGIFTRAGQIASFGVAVKGWTTYHGAFVNVHPELRLFRHLCTDPGGDEPMTSLTAERRVPVRMATVRSHLVRHFADVFCCERYHLYTGHPLWKSACDRMPSRAARVG